MQLNNKKQVSYAGFIPRMFSLLMDLLIVNVILLLIAPITNHYIYNGPTLSQVVAEITTSSIGTPLSFKDIYHHKLVQHFLANKGIIKILMDYLLQLVVCMLYFLVNWSLFNLTFGDILINYRMVDATTLNKPTIYQYLVRLTFSFLTVLSFGAGMFAILFNKQKQSWYDKASNIIVIKK